MLRHGGISRLLEQKRRQITDALTSFSLSLTLLSFSGYTDILAKLEHRESDAVVRESLQW